MSEAATYCGFTKAERDALTHKDVEIQIPREPRINREGGAHLANLNSLTPNVQIYLLNDIYFSFPTSVQELGRLIGSTAVADISANPVILYCNWTSKKQDSVAAIILNNKELVGRTGSYNTRTGFRNPLEQLCYDYESRVSTYGMNPGVVIVPPEWEDLMRLSLEQKGLAPLENPKQLYEFRTKAKCT